MGGRRYQGEGMAEIFVRITGRDPLLFRDGRPFADELGALSARTLRMPHPGTLAGFLRTRLGNLLGWQWNSDDAARARRISVAGPLLSCDRRVLFPAPADAVVHKGAGSSAVAVMTLRPAAPPPGAGCDIPDGLLPLQVTEDQKPEPGYLYWPADPMLAWLASSTGDGVRVPEPLAGPEVEARTHVAVDHARGTIREGRLFTTEGLAFGTSDRNKGFDYLEWSLLARVTGRDVGGFHGLAPFGGEGRLAYVESAEPQSWPQASPTLAERLQGGTRVRMVLATPACFAYGWKPGWLDAMLTGAPPSAPGVRLQLVSAAVPRRAAVSGWDYETKRPKAVRWLVPAGAVYFFTVVGGDPATLARSAWLESVCDDEQDRSDGYGLAVWGVWAPADGGRT
jgi:CRISPR-associated protein Cmr3